VSGLQAVPFAEREARASKRGYWRVSSPDGVLFGTSPSTEAADKLALALGCPVTITPPGKRRKRTRCDTTGTAP
jgi:hypothetical protein